eukprot:7457434-Pyramimonas_sp.AAC.1
MSHQDVVANINAGRRTGPVRMQPSLPVAISSVNRLLLHTDRRFANRIPDSTQAKSERVDELTSSESWLMQISILQLGDQNGMSTKQREERCSPGTAVHRGVERK